MYRKPKFLEVLHEIRQHMARECDYDIDLFIQMLRIEPARIEPGAEDVAVNARLKPRRPRTKRAKKES